MSDAFSDHYEGRNPWDVGSSSVRGTLPLDERIHYARRDYFSKLEAYLKLAKENLDKRKLASAEKLVSRSASVLDKLSGGNVTRGLSKTLKSLANDDQSAWARLLCSIDSMNDFYSFERLSPFSQEGVTVVECNGDSIKLPKGELRNKLQIVLPAKRESMSRYLAVTGGIGPLQIVILPGK